MARRELAERRRQEILDAFVELCEERGYRELELSAVAARAGVTQVELHHHFADKEALAIATENAALSEVVLAVASGYDPDRSEFDSVIAGIEAILEMIAEKPAYAHFGYIGSRQMGPASAYAIYETGHRTLEAMLERGWEYSQLAQIPGQVARAILGATEAMIRRELMAGRAERVPALLPDCVYMALVPFLGQEEALRMCDKARATQCHRPGPIKATPKE